MSGFTMIVALAAALLRPLLVLLGTVLAARLLWRRRGITPRGWVARAEGPAVESGH